MNQSNLTILTRIYQKGTADLAGLLSGSDFQRGKAAKLLAQVDEISARLGSQTDRWVSSAVKSQYQAAAVDAESQVRRLGFTGGLAADVDFVKINERAVNVFATQLARDLAGANLDAADKARRVISRTSQKIIADPEMSEIIAKGLISGGSLNNISRGLRTRLTQEGQKLLESGTLSAPELEEMADLQAGYITAGQRRMKLSEYCGLVASHQLRQATVEATKQRLADAGESMGDPMLFDLVTVVGPISGDFCDFYVGKIFSSSGKHPDYPPLSSIPQSGPPFHPNCTHTIAPFVIDLAGADEIKRGKIAPQFLNVDQRTAQKQYTGIERGYAARRAESPQASRSSVAIPHSPDGE